MTIDGPHDPRWPPPGAVPPGWGQRPLSAPAPVPMPGAPPSTPRGRVITVALAAVGLVLIVVGSFLPWLVSGQVRRNSYAVTGVLDRIGLAGDGALAVLVAVWPFLGPVCTVPVIVASLRWWRTAGVIGALIGLVTGVLSVGALIVAAMRGGESPIGLDPLGPTVMAVGASLLLITGIVLAVTGGRGARAPSRRSSESAQQ